MDEAKWMWVVLVAAALALVIWLAMWFLPAPGWRAAAVGRTVEEAPADLAAEAPAPVAPPEAAPLAEVAETGEPADAPPASLPDKRAPVLDEAAPTAEFHLRQTRWGMTREEVRAAEPDQPIRESERSLTYAATTVEWPSLLTYSFADGRLVRARLAFSDPAGQELPPLSAAQAQRRFQYLREELRGRYGEPVQESTRMPRDTSNLARRAAKHEELARQYDAEISAGEERLKKQRELLVVRYANWRDRDERIARGLAPYERDLRDLRDWKQEALANAAHSRQDLQKHQAANQTRPLLATMTASWPAARQLHDVELKLDLRYRTPRLEIRYEARRDGRAAAPTDEL